MIQMWNCYDDMIMQGIWRKQLQTSGIVAEVIPKKTDPGDKPTNDPENEGESTPPATKKSKDKQFVEEGDYENNKDLKTQIINTYFSYLPLTILWNQFRSMWPKI